MELIVGFTGENGVETSKTVRYRVPVGASPGVLYITASDAAYTNMLDLQAAIGAPVHSPAEVLELLNSVRGSTSAYVRVWRAETVYSVEGRDLPSPPPSLALILARAQPEATSVFNGRGSKIAEIEIPQGRNVITGSKTVQIEVKE